MSKINYFEKYLTTCFGNHNDYKASYRFFENDYLAFLPRDKEAVILDIGCGTGEFITYLRSKGYKNVHGVDISAEMVNFCRGKGIDNVEILDNLNYYLSNNVETFDLITLNDTLEHLPKEDTIDILKEIKSSLKKEGVFLLRTLNCNTIGGIYSRYIDFTHQTGYTETSLNQVLLMAGFSKIKIFGNKYGMNLNIRSIFRFILLRLWFLLLSFLYLIELGENRPRIYSKILVAVCYK